MDHHRGDEGDVSGPRSRYRKPVFLEAVMNQTKEQDADQLPPPSKPFRMFAAGFKDTLADSIGRYRINGDTNQAAAIALYAILSFIPLFILTILVISHLFGAHPEIQQEMIDGFRNFHPFFSGELMRQLGRIEEKRQVLGWVGFLSLLWSAAMIFGVIETALNRIFRSSSSRNYFLSKLLALSMIPLAWAVGMITVGITYLSTLLAEQAVFRAVMPYGLSFLNRLFLGYLVPFLIVVLSAMVAYRIIPTRKIPPASAAVGSFVFAVLMEVAKHFFTWYVARYTRYNVIFGSLETVVILVIWVFYVAVIFLFCAELVAAYERRDLILLEKALLKTGGESARVDERLYRKFGRFCPRGTYLFREGDTGREMYYLLAGRVRVEKEAGQVKKILAELGQGEYIGEMAALIEAPRTASVVTVQDSRIAVIDDRTFRNLLRESDQIALFMLREFSRRIRHTNEALDDLTQSWTRLAVLLFFYTAWPLKGDRDPAVELAVCTGKDLDDIREVIAGLAETGILKMEGGVVTDFRKEAAWDFFCSRSSA
ncbi:MAG TPA: YhjD/YihY/BrkB family envelope integrity protein [Syntrophales bacterium]|nr:YhjD/YihY/BrkB family envelope integrity protein [Syntrophales bacterium]